MGHGHWSAIRDDTLKECEDIQNYFVRSILAVPKSCPKPALCYESNLLVIRFYIYKEILNLTKHISQLDCEDLAKEVMDEQLKYGWPGLSTDAVKIAQQLAIDGLLDPDIPKKYFKNYVKKRIEAENESFLKNQIQS